MDIYSGIAKLYHAIVAGLQGKAPQAQAPPQELEKRVIIEQPLNWLERIMAEPDIHGLFPELDQTHFSAAFRATYANAIAETRAELSTTFMAKEHPEELDNGAVSAVLGKQACKRRGREFNMFWALHIKPARPSDYAPYFFYQ